MDFGVSSSEGGFSAAQAINWDGRLNGCQSAAQLTAFQNVYFPDMPAGTMR